jgi:hypothetical protein
VQGKSVNLLMDYNKVKLRPSQFKSVTSVTINEFDDLLPIYTARLERLLKYTKLVEQFV